MLWTHISAPLSLTEQIELFYLFLKRVAFGVRCLSSKNTHLITLQLQWELNDMENSTKELRWQSSITSEFNFIRTVTRECCETGQVFCIHSNDWLCAWEYEDSNGKKGTEHKRLLRVKKLVLHNFLVQKQNSFHFCQMLKKIQRHSWSSVHWKCFLNSKFSGIL